MYVKFGLVGFVVSQTSMSVISVVLCFMLYGNFDTSHLYQSYKTTWVSKINSSKEILCYKFLISFKVLLQFFEIVFMFFYSPSRTPWNQKVPLGYSADIIVQVISAIAYLMPNGLLLLLFIAFCLHHQVFCKMFENSLSKLKRNDTRPLIKLIQFHVFAKK